MIPDYFQNRHTVRNYSDKAVDDKLINDIVKAATKAPTCGNMQLYSVIISRDGHLRDKINAAHFNQPAAVNAPVILTICADFNRFNRWCELSGADPGFDNFLSFTSALLDATVLTQQITTIAEMQGLGTCFLGTTMFNAPVISEILELPELVVPVAALSIGWPAGDAEETERLPLEAILHSDKYPKLSDKEITELYKVKDEYPDNRQYVEENGKTTLAQVFTDIRYPRSMNESLTDSFLTYLRKQHFLK